jgi:hypothetical protein
VRVSEPPRSRILGAGRARPASIVGLTAGDLAREYGFTDIDGTQAKPFALA